MRTLEARRLHMRSAHLLLVSFLIAGCSPQPEPTADVFTLASGMELLPIAQSTNDSSDTYIRVKTEPDVYVVEIREYFHQPDSFAPPWLSLQKNGISTLNIGSEKKTGRDRG